MIRPPWELIKEEYATYKPEGLDWEKTSYIAGDNLPYPGVRGGIVFQVAP
jgi:hypothetical protein